MKTLPELKLEWQRHNQDNGLSWNEVSMLVDEVAALHPSEGDNDPVVNDPLTIGYIYNVIDLEEYNVPQCIVDEIFGKGYLLGLNHPTPTEQPKQEPSDSN